MHSALHKPGCSRSDHGLSLAAEKRTICPASPVPETLYEAFSACMAFWHSPSAGPVLAAPRIMASCFRPFMLGLHNIRGTLSNRHR